MIVEISEELAIRMEKSNLSGLVVGLKLKFINFEQNSKQKKLSKHICNQDDI